MRGLAMLLSLALFSSMTADLAAEHDPDAVLALVNRQHKLVSSHKPEDLVLPQVRAARGKADVIYMRREAAEALATLFAAAELEAGHTLYAVSGYRSWATQSSVYSRKVEAVGERRAQLTVAPPGASEHQLGLAMDINGETTLSRSLTQAFGESPEGIWVSENAHRFGFIIRYQRGKTDITGYAWEPWHLRYVGKDAAREIYELGITFEEYHELLAQRRQEKWT